MTEEKFTEFVRMTKEIVLSAVSKHLAARFHHSIDDVVQETYIRAYRGFQRGNFRCNSSLNTWIYTIARNESRRMSERLIREEAKFAKSVMAIKTETKNIRYDDEENIKAMKELIDNLPEKYRIVMERISMGFSERLIAEELAISRGTVKSRAYKGRELLHRIWNAENHNRG
jgi:RNA polymerase sigma-70 factor (ECF subfamily)